MKKVNCLYIFMIAMAVLTGCVSAVQSKSMDEVSGLAEEQSDGRSEMEKTTESGLEAELEAETGANAAISEHSTAMVKERNGQNMRRVAYFTSWSAYARNLEVNDIDGDLLTHVNFAFANVNKDGDILVGDSWADLEKPFGDDMPQDQEGIKGHFGQIHKMKKKYPHLKVLISVGGWTWSNNFSEVASSDAGRKHFAASAVEFLTRYGFDGIDIDWEFPVEGGNDITHRPEDRTNYTLLLKEVRSALTAQELKDGNYRLLTIAGGPNISFTRNTEIPEMMKYLDFINIMTYDYHGSWESTTGYNAPLYAPDGLSVFDTVNAYLESGAQADKLNLGLAFYGRGWGNAAERGAGRNAASLTDTGYGQGTWEAGVFDFWDLRENYEGRNNFVRYFDEQARVPYLYDGTTFISYDDSQSVREKIVFAQEKKLGGIMFWEFCGDKNKELQKMMNSFIGSGIPEENTKVSEEKKEEIEEETEEETDAWIKDRVYLQGDTVSCQNHVYRAKWWTQNEEPASHSKEWDVWELVR